MKNDHIKIKTVESQLLEHLNEFVGFARKRLANSELAADAVQDSLLKALRASDQLREEESAKAWFYRILRRTIIDLYRRHNAYDRALENFQHDLSSPPNEDEDRVTCACMERLLDTMTPQYAILVRQIDLNEEAPDAMAARLGISRGNLNVRLHRARQQLKCRLEETCQVCAKHGCLNCHSAQDAKPQKQG